MPTIEITQEQADALDRGEAITVRPRTQERHVVVHRWSGTVYLTRGPLNDAEWRVLHKGSRAIGDYTRFRDWDPDRDRDDFSLSVYDTLWVENA